MIWQGIVWSGLLYCLSWSHLSVFICLYSNPICIRILNKYMFCLYVWVYIPFCSVLVCTIHPSIYPSSTCPKVFLKNRLSISKKRKNEWTYAVWMNEFHQKLPGQCWFRLVHALFSRWNQQKSNLFSFPHPIQNLNTKKNRCSSAPVSWVRWRSSVMSVWARSCPGCRPGPVVTCPVRASRSSRNSASPSRLSSAICASTCSSVPGPGTNCGRRSSPSSTSAASRMRLPWVFPQNEWERDQPGSGDLVVFGDSMRMNLDSTVAGGNHLVTATRWCSHSPGVSIPFGHCLG